MAVAATAHYEATLHPTIDDIVRMICDFWRKIRAISPDARWKDIQLWKMDLKGANTLLSFKPEDVGIFGMMLTNNLVYFHIVGIFG